MKVQLAAVSAISLIAAGVCMAQGDPRGARIQNVTTLSAEQLAFMEHCRRNNAPVGQWFVSPAIVQRSIEIRAMLVKDGVKPLADRILEVYETADASPEITAIAVGLLQEAGYGYRMSTGDKALDRKMDAARAKEKDAEKLATFVNTLLDEILGRDHPRSRDVAAELLLSVFSEGLVSQHATSGNGNRRIEQMPAVLTARASELLGDADPFVHGMAEWAVSVNVCNDNDEKSKSAVWPADTQDEWFRKWMSVPADQHLDLDYIRQAVSLGMHRRGSDLLRLADDVMRRAEAKAAWAHDKMGPDGKVDVQKAISVMREAHGKLAAVVKASPGDLTACRKEWLLWRRTVRPVAMAGPDVDFEQVVYIKRWSGGKHLQPGIHDAAHPDGGDIYLQTGLEPTSPTKPLIGDRIPKGLAQDLDLWYDADRIVFSHTDERRLQKLYEMRLDGSELEKLTDGDYEDVDPAYLPDGKIVFGSMRAAAGTMCASSLTPRVGPGGASHTNIYRLDPETGDVRRLSYCKDDDCYPYVLNDGRVVYMRWDYQERGVDEIFSLWVVRPDGTGADGYYRVHIPDNQVIQSLRDARPVPGTNLITAAGGSHRSGQEGILMLCDTDAGINNPEGFFTVTPQASPISRGCGTDLRAVPEGGVPYIGGYIVKPAPLSDKSFLVSAGFDMPQSCNFWLYYMDVWGNKELIHRDKLMESVAVAPVRPRARPPVFPDMTDQSKNYASVYVDDVYADLPGVDKGEVKFIRIAQQLFWVTRAGEPGIQYHPLANASECFGYPGTGGPVRVFGTVPVQEDGSAYFEVPAGVDIYFQALDEDYRAVQRMRTHVEFAPGELRGCVGCHETRGDAARVRTSTIALAGKPVRPAAPPWGDTTLLNFEKNIQPVIEKKCVKCHGAEKPEGGLILTAAKDKYGFMQSFRSMFGLKPGDPTPDVVWAADGPVNKERVKDPDHPWWNIMFEDVIVRKSPHELTSVPTPPKRFGAIRHPFVTKLIEDEKHAKLLTDEEKQLLVAWFDLQCPYFDTYMQQMRVNRKNELVRIKVDPFPPFGDTREHTVHYFEGK